MKLLTIVLFLMSVTALAGQEKGGGSLVYVNGKFEPADLYYVAPNDLIPNSFTRVDFKNYPKALDAFNDALDFLNRRSEGQADFSTWDWQNTEFYFVPKLSGDDVEPVSEGVSTLQVSFTREIFDISSAKKPKRIIIEIMRGLFDQLTPENQALVLTHEFMHHKSYGQHSVISPIIKSLSILLPLRHLQANGDRSHLSTAQLEASEQLQNILISVAHVKGTKISRWGGGVLFKEDKNYEDNFISVDSSLDVTFANTPVDGNVLINSQVALPFEAHHNTFINTQLLTTYKWPSHSKMSLNTFQNCIVQRFDGASATGDRLSLTGNRLFDVITPELELSGDRNILEHLSVESNWGIAINGSQSVVRYFSQREVAEIVEYTGRQAQIRYAPLWIHGEQARIDHVTLTGAGGVRADSKTSISNFKMSFLSKGDFQLAPEVHLLTGASLLNSTFDADYGCAVKIRTRVAGQKLICDN